MITGAAAVLGFAASAEPFESDPGTTGAGAGTIVVWVLGVSFEAGGTDVFSMMGCVVWAARLDLDDTLTVTALEAKPALGALASPKVWLDGISVALLLLPLSLGLTLLVPRGLLLLLPPGLALLPSPPLGLALLLMSSPDEVGDAPAPDDETGSGIEDLEEGVGSSDVEGVGAADGEVSWSEVDEEAESESEVEVDEVDGSGVCSDSEEDGTGEADEADDDEEPPSRQLESLDFSTVTPCLYLRLPVESLTWKIRVSEPAGRLTFQVVESPWRPLKVLRVVEPT